MPVSLVRRHAARALVAATALAAVVAVAPFVATAATPSVPVTSAPLHVRAETTRVELVAGSSEARYHANEVFLSSGPNEAVGRTNNVAGAIEIGADGSIAADKSRIAVDLTSLQSDSANRDRYIKANTLKVADHPNAIFVVTSAPGLPVPLPTSGNAAFELVGDLTVHGVTRPATWQAVATFAEGEVVASATTTVLMTDFGMTPPKVASLASIEDAVTLVLDVRATVAPTVAELLSDQS